MEDILHNKDIKKKKLLPYHNSFKNLKEHLSANSKTKNKTLIRYSFRKLLGYLCEILASNCPFNSIRIKLHRLRGVNIGKNVFIGRNCTLDHAYPEYIYLEDGCGLAGDVYILAHNTPNESLKSILESYAAPVIIKKNSWVGIRSTVLPGVIIGSNSVVSAGCIVRKSVPDNSLLYSKGNMIIKLNHE